MSRLTVILPAYNEEENLTGLVERWQRFREPLKERYGLELQLAVVNDGSRDRTEEIAKRLEEEYDNFTLLSHPHNMGLGEAVKTGLSYFIGECPESEYLCLMDCDNTQDPVYITDLLECMQRQGADVVIASRYQKGATVEGVSQTRLLMSGGARYIFTALLHVPRVKDYTCGYRLYGRDILLKAHERFGERLVEESGFTCMVELLYKLYSCGAIFSEVPFGLRYDLKKGASKMAVMKTVVNSIRLALRIRKIEKN